MNVNNTIKHRYPDISENNKPVNFFRTAYQVFQEAEQNVKKSVSRFYSIGGYIVRLNFAGPALVPLITPALEHLSVSQSASPSLNIYLWDSESTKVSMPPPPWTLDDYSARGEINDYNTSHFFTACNKGSGALSVLDRNNNTALWWIRSASNVPFYESGSPLLTIFHWWLQQNGRQVVHAGAAGTREGGVLLIGKGGSGKSTTTLACLNSELFYAGDDYSIINSSPSPYVFSLYSSGKLNADHINRFPHLLPIIDNSDRIKEEKPLLFLNQHYPFKMISEFPIKAIFLPRISHLRETTLSSASQANGLKALAPNTLFQLSSATHSSFLEITKFVKQLPCYYLNIGTEINRIPEVISNFLSGN